MIEGSGKNELGPIKIIPQCIIILYLLMPYQSGIAQTTGHGYQPEQYTCYKATEKLNIDGLLDEADWGKAIPTKPFVDIEGEKRPLPWYETRVQMLWDEEYFYIAAELEEENIWATYSQHDAVIYQENNFEVFIDPDGDTHNYYELEINALGTVWDLLLTQPYRDGGLAINGWDISGLKKGVHLSGTLNDPADTDRKWSVELAIPWKAVTRQRPEEGSIWRVNFSRVEWRIEEENGNYQKTVDPSTGKPLPENNWVWSPQGVVAMHQPETWGFVQFTETRAGEKPVAFRQNAEDEIKWQLRQVYYAERKHKKQYGQYTSQLSELGLKGPFFQQLLILADEHIFVARARSEDHFLYIREDGRVWKEPVP